MRGYHVELKKAIQAITATPVVHRKYYNLSPYFLAFAILAIMLAIMLAVTVSAFKWTDRAALERIAVESLQKRWETQYFYFPKESFNREPTKKGNFIMNRK